MRSEKKSRMVKKDACSLSLELRAKVSGMVAMPVSCDVEYVNEHKRTKVERSACYANEQIALTGIDCRFRMQSGKKRK